MPGHLELIHASVIALVTKNRLVNALTINKSFDVNTWIQGLLHSYHQIKIIMITL